MKNCDICGKQLKISSMGAHLKAHEESRKSIDNRLNRLSIDSLSAKGSKRRASAIKYCSYISLIHLLLILLLVKSIFNLRLQSLLTLSGLPRL